MPNITCIKTLIATLAFAMPLQAQSAPPTGCFIRDYTDAHLAANPNQIVDQISLGFAQHYNERMGFLNIVTAKQGLVQQQGLGGQSFAQTLYCTDKMDDSGRWSCGVECDGGRMEILRLDGEILEFKTDYLLVGETDECGGNVDLAETQGHYSTYRLHRVADHMCDTSFPSPQDTQN